MNMVQALPDDKFNQGQTLHKEQKSCAKMKELSPAEKSKLNRYAKALIMADNRKASAIGDYVKQFSKRIYCLLLVQCLKTTIVFLEHFWHKCQTMITSSTQTLEKFTLPMISGTN